MGIVDIDCDDGEGLSELHDPGPGADFAMAGGVQVIQFELDGGDLALPAELSEQGHAGGGIDERGRHAAMQRAEDVGQLRTHLNLHGDAVLPHADHLEAERRVERSRRHQAVQFSTAERSGFQICSMALEGPMAFRVTTFCQGSVAIIGIDNPPVNALVSGLAESVALALEEAAEAEAITAVVVVCAGRTFVAGADIRELGETAAGRMGPITLSAAFNRIEACAKPVVMAIHGTALGGGLELAMSGHYRIALSSANVGQPEVNLGLIPGAGATQRLPRLCGIAKALELCVTGRTITAAEALEAGIIDRIVEKDLVDEAVAYAASLGEPRRTGSLPRPAADAAAVAAARNDAARRMRGQTAPPAAIEAIEASARLEFAEGLQEEKRLFEQCLHGPQAKALMHLFFAEREVGRIPGAAAEELPAIEKAAILGAGTMGRGIAMCFANAGIPVRLSDQTGAALDSAMAAIRDTYEAGVKKGRLSAADVETRMALISRSASLEGFDEAGIVVEAVYEDLEAKKRVFQQIDAVARPGAILATNTSTLDIDLIAGATGRPEWVCGFHFFSPAHIMKLLEIVRGRATSLEVMAAAMALGKRLRKTAVPAGNCPGFIGNRMFAPYREAAIRCVEQGASPWAVDEALTGWGMAMGPIRVGDLSGLDILREVRIAAGLAGTVEDRLIEAGRLGEKTGQGWYSHAAGRKAEPDSAVDELVRAYRNEMGIGQRAFTADEIVERCIQALRTEGGKILAEGMALRAADIDIVYVHGYGFPAWRGGPMFKQA
ncbi:MAG: 3-hydroxyacyl-CoA dehydrogenase [Candidatus Solibacter sp.]|nr:3-hydroxyacyl-CoA dehydrogenase [Candidatus Solibacter sp.]